MAPTYTVDTVQTWISRQLGDVAKAWISSTRLNQAVASGLLSSAGTYTFTKRVTGVYTCDTFSEEQGTLMLFTSATTPFTGEGSNVYEVNCTGSIWVTTGTHSTDTISVAGAPVDIAAAIGPLLRMLISVNSGKTDVSIGGESVSIGPLIEQYIRLYQLYCGAH